VVLVPGLLAAGVGSLIFIGLNSWTGFGDFSLSIPDIPAFTTPDVAEFGWAIGIGIAAAVLGSGIRRMALLLQPVVERSRVLATTAAGLSVAVLAIVFGELSDESASQVLFSGQSALPGLIHQAESWTVGALVLLVVCKSLAYGASLSAFRGGPTFPGMYIGAVGGIALSHLPGLPMIAGVAMGIGAMTVAMLGFPLTSVLVVVIFLQADAIGLTPLVIVAVVVSYVTSAHLAPSEA
ncbi:MAG: chloride channel protein, partial [Acidimicrobiales bacterium]